MKDSEVEAYLRSDDAKIRSLATEIHRLRSAIQKHRSASGHELCWLNDVELWKSIEKDPHYPHESLPIQEEFLKQCSRYHESRLKGSPYQEPAAEKTVAD